MTVSTKTHRVRFAVAGGVAALLWFGSGLLVKLLQGTRISHVTELVLPITVPRMIWGWPTPWGMVGLIVVVLTVGTLSWVALTLTERLSRTRLVFSAAWLLIVVVATAVGACSQPWPTAC